MKYGLPQSFSKLNQLKYFEVSYIPTVTQFPMQICNLKKLQGIDHESLPKCITEMIHLAVIRFATFGFLKSFPIEIFNNDH